MKVDELREPPVVGRMYLVRCVWWPTGRRWMPVIGPVHSDPELGVWRAHLHYDLRFLTNGDVHRRTAEDYMLLVHMVMPGDPDPVYKVRRCARAQPEFPAWHGRWVEFEKRWHGATAKGCKVCPHRGIALTTCPTDAEGGVVCPGHGLRFNRETGKLMPRITVARAL